MNNFIKSVYFFFIVLVCSSEAFQTFLRKHFSENGVLRSFHVDDPYYIKERWFDQSRDHFSPEESKIEWKQRYWINESFWDKHNGPVFLYVGGESAATANWLIDGEMIDLANKYRGFAIVIEHRYYGDSMPTKDMSTSNLKYLSSQQALADIARFHEYIVEKYNMTDANRWIAYGGSYPGALSAWLRIKYPHLIYGAVASSAPVLAKYDFVQYLQVVQDSLSVAYKGKECVESLAEGYKVLQEYLFTSKKYSYINDLFHLEWKIEHSKDAELFSENVAEVFMGVVQYNNDSRSFPPSYNMNNVCRTMTNESMEKPFDRLVYLVMSTMGGAIESSYERYIKHMKNTDFGASVGERQWFYQKCTEFGFFKTTDSNDQPFGTTISLSLYTDACKELFGISSSRIQDNVKKTNDYYGGKDINKNVTNIVFPNGSIDPWHALGITSSITDNLVAIFIDGTAHCANMYPASHYDSPELVKARAAIDRIVGEWLRQ